MWICCQILLPSRCYSHLESCVGTSACVTNTEYIIWLLCNPAHSKDKMNDKKIVPLKHIFFTIVLSRGANDWNQQRTRRLYAARNESQSCNVQTQSLRNLLFFKSKIQTTLVISNPKGISETLRDIRTSTHQICRIEEQIIQTTTFNK